MRIIKQLIVLLLFCVALAGCRQRTEERPSSVYGVDYLPVRIYESSVLNQPDIHGRTPEIRVNGTGFGPTRPEMQTPESHPAP
jgi:hypothetical protein